MPGSWWCRLPGPHPVAHSRDGFLGTEPFGRAYEGLEERDAEPIVWSMDDLAKSLPPGPRPESPRVPWVFTADAGCCVTAT